MSKSGFEIEAKVTRKSRFGLTENIEDVYSVPELDNDVIREILIGQTEEFSDDEILEGRTFGGIFIDVETEEWLYVCEHTDKIVNEIGTDASTAQINIALNNLFKNIKSGFSNYENEPSEIKLV